MINYLKGTIIDIVKIPANRMILILEVNQIAYEIQVTSRWARELSLKEDKNQQIFTHLQIREEQPTLYGFVSLCERDLFRQLISVSGIGTQLAIALIDTLGLDELVQAIVSERARTLCKAPGVGQKTAERIILELKTKLIQWQKALGLSSSRPSGIPEAALLEELELTLLALGYTANEIQQTITVLSQDEQLLQNPQIEEWIRQAIAWLSS